MSIWAWTKACCTERPARTQERIELVVGPRQCQNGIYQELDKRPTVFFSTRHDGVLGEYGRHERGYQTGQVAAQSSEGIPSLRPVDIEGFTV